MIALANAGAWVAGAFALACGFVAGWVQLRSVTKQQSTSDSSNVISGYDKLVEDLQTEVKTAREETRRARDEAHKARKEARDTRLAFEKAEREKHSLTLQIMQLEQGLAELKATVERYHNIIGPDLINRVQPTTQPLWPEPEGEGDTT